MSENNQFQESCLYLKSAVEIIEGYALETERKLPKLARELISKFVFARFNKEYQNKLRQKNESLLNAIDVIKCHRVLIEKLRHGSKEQQALACAALRAIKHYNAVVRKVLRKKRNWQRLMPDFLTHRMPTPLFPSEYTIDLALPVIRINDAQSKEVKKVAASSEKIASCELSRQDTDVFCMKGISLLKQHYPSIGQTQETIREAFINIEVDKLSKLISLSTELMPLPGERLTLKGKFKQGVNRERNIPIPKTFHLSSKAIQTAFPHPLQYLGFLCDKMIPSCPHRPDEMLLLPQYLKRKARCAYALLPKGNFNLRAKVQLEQRKRVFAQFGTSLIKMHREFLYAVIPQERARIAEIFAEVSSKESSYQFISEVYDAFASTLLEGPYERLLNVWLEYQHSHFRHYSSDERFQTASDFLKGEAKRNLQHYSKEGRSLLQLLDEYIRPACHKIMLQYLSEDFEFEPPVLNAFDQKIQLLLYRQLISFMRELEENQVISYEKIVHLMTYDTMLFQDDSGDELSNEAKSISDEITNYFLLRYHVRFGGTSGVGEHSLRCKEAKQTAEDHHKF